MFGLDKIPVQEAVDCLNHLVNIGGGILVALVVIMICQIAMAFRGR